MVSYCAYSSHPPNPAQSFFTQPTPDASQSVTRDARELFHPPSPAHAETCAYPGEHRLTNDPSMLACSSHTEQPGSVQTCAYISAFSQGSTLISSKSCCFLLGQGLVDLPLRAWTSTALLAIRLIWCARSASKGDQQPFAPFVSGRARSASKGDQQPLPPPASLAFQLFALLDSPIPV